MQAAVSGEYFLEKGLAGFGFDGYRFATRSCLAGLDWNACERSLLYCYEEDLVVHISCLTSEQGSSMRRTVYSSCTLFQFTLTSPRPTTSGRQV